MNAAMSTLHTRRFTTNDGDLTKHITRIGKRIRVITKYSSGGTHSAWSINPTLIAWYATPNQMVRFHKD